MPLYALYDYMNIYILGGHVGHFLLSVLWGICRLVSFSGIVPLVVLGSTLSTRPGSVSHNGTGNVMGFIYIKLSMVRKSYGNGTWTVGTKWMVSLLPEEMEKEIAGSYNNLTLYFLVPWLSLFRFLLHTSRNPVLHAFGSDLCFLKHAEIVMTHSRHAVNASASRITRPLETTAIPRVGAD